MDLAQRFWSHVDQSGGPTACWPWTGSKRKVRGQEYGRFKWTNPVTGKRESTNAARVAIYLTRGRLPDQACHSCNNPPCCNPFSDHVYDGDAASNGLDKAIAGRARGNSEQWGEDNRIAVLTAEIVVEARKRSKAGETQQAIADSLNVELATLAYAIGGRTWSHIDAIEAPHVRRVGGGSRLTEDDIRTIRRRAASGETQSAIAEDYGLNRANISHIVSRKTWAHIWDEENVLPYTPRASLSDRDVVGIRQRVKRGESCTHLSTEYPASVEIVRKAAFDPEAWAHLNATESPAEPPKRAVGNAAFTEDQVRDIRRRHADGESVPKIHKDYPGRGLQTLYAITQRRTWKHVTD
jgi:uncharacterized protein (DUF433 family)